MANQDLFFDITKTGVEQEKQQYIINRVGDGGLKTVTVHVYSNGTPYNLTGLVPVFEGVKPDDTKIIDADGGLVLDAKNGVFRYTFPLQASTSEGEYKQAFFKLRRGEQTDSTIELKVTVLPNRVEIGINSESYLTDFQKAYKELESKVKEALEALDNTAENTKLKINGNKTIADTLRTQLDAIQSSVDDGNLVTTEQLHSEISALSDMISKIAAGLKDTKSTVDQSVNAIEKTTVSALVSNQPVADIAAITETGYYFYDTTTRNLPPVMDGGNANGYLHAVMRDPNNGMIEILGTGFAREKYGGTLFGRWSTTKPVKLWTGSAKKGATLNLRGSVKSFGYLIFDVKFYTNHFDSLKIRTPDLTEGFYLDSFGAKTNGNVANSTLEEVTLSLTDETHILVKDTQWASSNGTLTTSDQIEILGVYGVL